MKLKYLSLEFLLIFLCFALPPLFAPASPGGHALPRFSWASAQSLAVALLLSVQLDRELPRRHGPPVRSISLATVCFGMLMLIYAAVELGAMVLARLPQHDGAAPAELALSGAGQWIHAIAALASGAFYEECLYRAFLPEIPLLLLARTPRDFPRKHEKALACAIEAACAILFACSHRYLGGLAVLNALLCGIVLRRCYKKSGSILCGTAAHFCYNLTLLAFSSIAAAAS